MFPPSRPIMPAMPAQAYKTYAVVNPPATHFTKATCAEVDCDAFTHGWRTIIDEGTEQGQAQAHYIRKRSGRRFTEDRNDAGLTVFTFEPGQRCFGADRHVRRLDRPSLFLVRDGDWRGNPYGTRSRMHTRPEFWVEDFAEHQQALADQIRKG